MSGFSFVYPNPFCPLIIASVSPSPPHSTISNAVEISLAVTPRLRVAESVAFARFVSASYSEQRSPSRPPRFMTANVRVIGMRLKRSMVSSRGVVVFLFGHFGTFEPPP
uniref:Secreted protein n=1 Tax=Globodera pallida TaxID=36090 RepID=A0A183BUV0_GLOPA